MQDFFTKQQWNFIQGEYEAWWTGKSDHPIINLVFTGADPQMKRPEGLITENTYLYSMDESAERIAEKMEYIHRSHRYEFHGYPMSSVYFGPLYRTEFLGCRPKVGSGTVWYAPEKKVPAEELTICPDPNSIYLPRVKQIYQAIDQRFDTTGYVIGAGGSNKFGPGHILDVVTQFFDPEEMALMLLDEPEEVHRLMAEATVALDKVGEELYSLTGNAVGYSGYSNLFAPEPWIIMQCDFCTMIGPHHFDEFVIGDMIEATRRSPRYNFYHLDGPGEIIHMDKLLALPDLKCMQWVPLPYGDKQQTLDVCNRIHRAGKNQWVLGTIDHALEVARNNGTAKGLYWYGEYPIEEHSRVMKVAEELMNMG